MRFKVLCKQARNIAEQNGSFLKQYLTQEYDSGLVGIVKVCRKWLLTLLVPYVEFDLISEPIFIICDAALNSGEFTNGIFGRNA